MVSVLLLSWNHEKYIEQSLSSIMNQTCKDIEIIYLDNNSSDNTFTIAENILKNSGLKYKPFKRETNCTIVQNFNLLTNESSGEFLCLLSGDDWLHPQNIEKKLYPFKKNEKLALVYSDGYTYYDDLNIYVPEKITKPADSFFLKELLQRNIISATGCVIRKQAIVASGLWDENLLLEDWDMWIRLAMKYDIDKIDIPLYYYRKHVGSISANAEFMYNARKQVGDKYQDINENPKQTERNNWETYIAMRAHGKPSLSVAWKILINFKPNMFYLKLLIKSLLPASLKQKYFARSLRKKYSKDITNNTGKRLY